MKIGPGGLVKQRRERLGLSQRQLALRAGTTQAAVSRIERGLVSPTFDTLRSLLLAMGEEPVLDARRLDTDWGPAHVSREDLIKMKAAAARPIDVSDVAALTEREHQKAGDEAQSRKSA